MLQPEKVLRFHEFELDSRQHELRRHGHRVRMSASQLRLLTLFLSRRGELITRDDIARCLWTDTATIDVANGVNTAINRLRSHLRDDSASPRFIETVISVGYRFIAPVEEPVEAIAAAVEPDSAALPEDAGLGLPAIGSPVRTARTGLWLSMAAAVMGIAAVAMFARRHADVRPVPVVPTSAAAPAFRRVTSNDGGRQVIAEALSPDGNLLAYADLAGVRVETLATHAEFSLPALPTFRVTRLGWFPDETALLVSGQDLSTGRSLVRILPLSSAYSPVLAEDADLAALSPDGLSLVFTRRHGSEVWSSLLNGDHLHRVVAASGRRVVTFLLWSADGRRIVVASHTPVGLPPAARVSQGGAVAGSARGDWSYDSVDAVTGKLLAHEDVPLESAAMLGDGRMVFVTGSFTADPFLLARLVSVQTDSATGRFVSQPAPVPADVDARSLTGISASADGAKIALLGQKLIADVATASLRLSAGSTSPMLAGIEPLAVSLEDEYPHAWTQDGAVVYETMFQGFNSIFAKKTGQSSPVLVAHMPFPAFMPQVSSDGKWILFLALGPEAGAASVYRVPAAGGTPVRVPIEGEIDEFRCPTRAPAACVVREARPNENRRYFAFDPVEGRGRLLARTAWQPSRRGDWGLSPDGLTIVVANHDVVHPSLELVRFGSDGSAQPMTVPFEGHGTPLGARWSADGRVMFVETRTASGFELLAVTPGSYRTRLLLESPLGVWVVPSADDSRVAFPRYDVNSNVWVR